MIAIRGRAGTTSGGAMKRTMRFAATATMLAIGLTACVQSGPTVATFEVAGQGTFKVELATPELIKHAKDLMAGTTDDGTIPIGTVVRGDPGVNAPWSWHIYPATFEFADQTTEVCDGIPQYVEDDTVTSPYYCPWSADVIAIEGPGA